MGFFSFFEDIGKAVVSAAKTVGNAVVKAANVVADGFSKDGAVTNFVQNYVPLGGLVTAAVHGIAGNRDYAEYAAVKGLSTTVSTAISAVGVLGGPAGAMLASGVGAVAGNLIEGGFKSLMKPAVKDKLDDITWAGVGTSLGVGLAVGMLGPAGKAFKGTGVAKALTGVTSKALKPLANLASKASHWIKPYKAPVSKPLRTLADIVAGAPLKKVPNVKEFASNVVKSQAKEKFTQSIWGPATIAKNIGRELANPIAQKIDSSGKLSKLTAPLAKSTKSSRGPVLAGIAVTGAGALGVAALVGGGLSPFEEFMAQQRGLPPSVAPKPMVVAPPVVVVPPAPIAPIAPPAAREGLVHESAPARIEVPKPPERSVIVTPQGQSAQPVAGTQPLREAPALPTRQPPSGSESERAVPAIRAGQPQAPIGQAPPVYVESAPRAGSSPPSSQPLQPSYLPPPSGSYQPQTGSYPTKSSAPPPPGSYQPQTGSYPTNTVPAKSSAPPPSYYVGAPQPPAETLQPPAQRSATEQSPVKTYPANPVPAKQAYTSPGYGTGSPPTTTQPPAQVVAPPPVSSQVPRPSQPTAAQLAEQKLVAEKLAAQKLAAEKLAAQKLAATKTYPANPVPAKQAYTSPGYETGSPPTTTQPPARVAVPPPVPSQTQRPLQPTAAQLAEKKLAAEKLAATKTYPANPVPAKQAYTSPGYGTGSSPTTTQPPPRVTSTPGTPQRPGQTQLTAAQIAEQKLAAQKQVPKASPVQP